MASTGHVATSGELADIHDSDRRYDLIRGELVEMAPAGGVHGEIAAGIVGRLWMHARTNSIGRVYTSETGFVLARRPDTVLAPDAAFIRSERVPERNPGFYEVAPDLVVEVIFPGDSAPYVSSKVIEYLDAGVRMIWIIDPSRESITVYLGDRSARVLTRQDLLDAGDVVEGFSVPVSEIFE